MGKSIRSKVKRKFRAVKRDKFAPIVKRRMEETEEVLNQVLEGKAPTKADDTNPLDKWLTTYGEDLDKKVNGPPKNENNIDVRGSEFLIDMNKKKQLSSITALQGPVFKQPQITKGKMDLKTAIGIVTMQEMQEGGDDMEMDDVEKKAKKMSSGKTRRRSKRKKKNRDMRF
mmetsp:Transcript_16923/g.20374  ORF Transcript_16923/g.20374 Transcript_16923/m.20374 type:complete len:171 (+) Transcript_16923:31-543(+)|eukprot:jgi/Bigna1/90420/estExt_fgenesh1_pg.C_700032